MALSNSVCLAECGTYDYDLVRAAVFRCLDFYSDVTNGAKTVVLKPNLIRVAKIEEAATTNPLVVRACAEYFVSRGCRTYIYDSPSTGHSRGAIQNLYRATGMEAAANETGAELYYPEKTRSVRNNGREFVLPELIFEADLLINLAKLKTHCFTGVSAAVKNHFGLIPGLLKAGVHAVYPDAEVFAEYIVALNTEILSRVKEISLIDGIIGMEGKGPTGGTPKKAGVIIASDNPFAADIAAIEIMGARLEEAPINAAGVRHGLCPPSIEGIDVSGARTEDVKTRFKAPKKRSIAVTSIYSVIPKGIRKKAEEKFRKYPSVNPAKCAGCGKCEQICPKGAAKVKDGVFTLDKRRCIKCYCCHEVCAFRALDV